MMSSTYVWKVSNCPKTLLGSKDPAEIRPYVFDFDNLLQSDETISSVEVSVSLHYGVDPAESLNTEMLEGSATIYGSQVTQVIKSGVNQCQYYLYMIITTNLNNQYVGVNILPVIDLIPIQE